MLRTLDALPRACRRARGRRCAGEAQLERDESEVDAAARCSVDGIEARAACAVVEQDWELDGSAQVGRLVSRSMGPTRRSLYVPPTLSSLRLLTLYTAEDVEVAAPVLIEAPQVLNGIVAYHGQPHASSSDAHQSLYGLDEAFNAAGLVGYLDPVLMEGMGLLPTVPGLGLGEYEQHVHEDHQVDFDPIVVSMDKGKGKERAHGTREYLHPSLENLTDARPLQLDLTRKITHPRTASLRPRRTSRPLHSRTTGQKGKRRGSSRSSNLEVPSMRGGVSRRSWEREGRVLVRVLGGISLRA